MRSSLFVALASAAVALSSCVARAGVLVQPAPIPVRVANSEIVFIGKVTDIEPVDVEAKTFPDAKETTKYTIAIVRIDKAIAGLKDEKTLRVGFLAGKKVGPIGLFNPRLTPGQEGVFMISKHHEGKFWQAPQNGFFISKEAKTFEDDIKTVNKAVAIMKDTKTALQSKDADERLIAAAMQIGKYRAQKAPFPNKEEPINAEESKLILNALVNAKWGAVTFGQPNPQQLFFQLNVRPEDGWKAPQKANADELRQAIQAWLSANAGTYRIKRFVPGETKQ